ncbi:MAG: phosphate ABC transporter permease subunit PstC [Candidatus Xiphinematobacter sp.]|nr:MAG: phosphate ABC transporter permease subunit PstC [Candidatus Xiphinematobacter sp.]
MKEKKRAKRLSWSHPADWLYVLCWTAAAATVALLAWIVLEIFSQALPSLRKFGLQFFIRASWNPNTDHFGALPFLVGTTMSSVFALLIALPLGIAIAIFLSEDFLPSVFRQSIRFVVELLAAIPSVVYGLWGATIVIPIVRKGGNWLSNSLGFVPLFQGPVFGNSMLAASLILALMVLPTITAISRNALVDVPKTLREGAYALGATRWEAIFGVILPTASPGIVAATILALGRAMGETMAVAMLIGNSTRLTFSLLAPAGTLASLLANQFAEAEGLQVSSLMHAALLLMLLTLLVNATGEIILRRTQRITVKIRQR